MMSRLIKAVKQPKDALLYLISSTPFGKLFSDEAFLKMKYRLIMGTKLDLDNPKTFNEKLQWLKIYDRKPEYTMMVDKYAVREYIAEKLGEEYLIPLLGVWDDPDDIDFDALPDKFVLKCNHNSGLGMCICRDKSKLDIEKVKKELRKGLKQDYYLTGREWPYKNVKRKIIAEKYMENHSEEDLVDYKFFCFNGSPKFLYVSQGLAGHNAMIDFMSLNWEKEVFTRDDYKSFDTVPSKPLNFDIMIEFSKILSENIPHVRVDFYEINNRIYFGELTFCTAAGFSALKPDEYNRIIGNYLDISSIC